MNKNVKPECYGDYQYYDPEDQECQDCAFIDACGIRARRSMRMHSESKSREQTSSRAPRMQPAERQQPTRAITTSRRGNVTKQTETQVFTEPGDKDTYWSVLSHNAGLEAVQAMFDELSNSVRHIPRKSYSELWKRPKK